MTAPRVLFGRVGWLAHDRQVTFENGFDALTTRRSR
jgi:hypothetical protein